MEFVDGEDLAALLRRVGRLPEEKAVEVARQLCGALAAVHDQGLLYRDLKPANVMLDGRGKVRLADFGLAAVAGEATDVRSGTAAYQAPEQLAVPGGQPGGAGPPLCRGGAVEADQPRQRAEPRGRARRSSR